ncbi:MAG: amino acid adenylation domain-containing protein [Chryseotalea sp. WA131a]|nr:MAG: amino acid adenylation domain-containing protein [Chryseotalea sp. WA131a]
MEKLIEKLRESKIMIKVRDNDLELLLPDEFDSDQLLDEVRKNKSELITYLQKVSSDSTLTLIPKCRPKKYYKLSSAQKRLYFLYEFERESLAYNIPIILRITGELNKKKLERAIRKLVDRHESLRTSFILADNAPYQVISPEGTTRMECSFSDVAQLDKTIATFIRPFDLLHDPLFRVGLVELSDASHLLILDMHHIIVDGISQEYLINDFKRLYDGESLPPLRRQYKDYAEWQQSKKRLQAISEQAAFWKSEYQDEVVPLELPIDFPRQIGQKSSGHTLKFTLQGQEKKALNEFATTAGTTSYMVCLAMYYVLLSKLSNQEDIVIGTPVSTQGRFGLDGVVGMFVNTLALRNCIPGDLSFQECVRRVTTKTLNCFENQDYGYEELIEELNLTRNITRNPLFDVLFSYQNNNGLAINTQSLKIEPSKYSHEAPNFDLTLSVLDSENLITFSFEYKGKLFREETISRFITYFKMILGQALNNPMIKLRDIRILSDEEQDQILNEFNATQAEYPASGNVIELFEEQVSKNPNNIALIWRDERISFSKLYEQTTKVAHWLIAAHNIRVGDQVGVMLEREAHLIPLIFGILKAGGVYVPIDPRYPIERKYLILGDARLKVLFSRKNFMEDLVTGTCQTVDIEQIWAEIENSEADFTTRQVAKGSDLAYIIYTSGSTGVPKGVMVEHHSVVNRILWMQKRYSITNNDVILQKTPLVFDVSVWELLWWAFTGASLCLLEPGDEKDPYRLMTTIQKYDVTTLHFVPSMLRSFLSAFTPAYNVGILTSLKKVFASGEALKIDDTVTFGRTLGKGPRLINLYGPTEATVDVSYYDCSPGEIDDLPSVPIGRPIDNIQLYVLDKYDNLQPVGIAGELCISGAGVARGYFNNSSLTESVFTYNPFPGGTRLYRTGDMAMWLPDGNIVFLGRKDDQVKIRGNRIELGEIENAVAAYPGVIEAVVLMKQTKCDDKELVVYFTGSSAIENRKIREHLARTLPDYMIPVFYVQLDQLPLTFSGKIDKKKLIAMPERSFENTRSFEAPGTEIELKLAEIWEHVLRTKAIGVNDDFFEMGGHSLLAIRLIYEINDKFKVQLSVKAIFQFKSINLLARHIQYCMENDLEKFEEYDSITL